MGNCTHTNLRKIEIIEFQEYDDGICQGWKITETAWTKGKEGIDLTIADAIIIIAAGGKRSWIDGPYELLRENWIQHIQVLLKSIGVPRQ